eukprot:TRINITY_DN1821_c0_g1_i1.p1 TRINITY_DN1821_c0_g1~~TRINITY_DN1821_c0_g1_i1.p1  ORF type:complete len:1100 (+),score=212.35 TRINITY_DN1821_c0_g1_i1:105-3302(+)
MAVADLATDFSDGLALINLVEVLTAKPIPKYNRRPISRIQKIDNVSVGITFMEKHLGYRAVGANPAEIATGNLKQVMSFIFFLIQKFPTPAASATASPIAPSNPSHTSAPSLTSSSFAEEKLPTHGAPVKQQQPTHDSRLPVAHKPSPLHSSEKATIPKTKLTPAAPPPEVAILSDAFSKTPVAADAAQTVPVAAKAIETETETLYQSYTGTALAAMTTESEATQPEPVSSSVTTPATLASSTPTVPVEVASVTNETSHTLTSTIVPTPATITPEVPASPTTVAISEAGSPAPAEKPADISSVAVPVPTEKPSDTGATGEAQPAELEKLKEGHHRHRASSRSHSRGHSHSHSRPANDSVCDEADYARKLVKAQAVCRGWLARRKISQQIARDKARNCVAQELLSTERTYVENLQTLNTVFVDPVRSRLPEELAHILSNLGVIQQYSLFLLTELEKRMTTWSKSQRLGDVFVKFASFLKVYTTYVNCYETCFQLVNEQIKKDKEFKDHLEACKNNPACKGLDMHSFLILPVQRIPRYVLMLNDLFKNTPEDHPDRADLEKALQGIRNVAGFVNEKKREAEYMNEVFAIQETLVGVTEGELVAPHRRFVKKGMIVELVEEKQKTVAVPTMAFLFNDALVLSTPKETSHKHEQQRRYRFRAMQMLRNCYEVDAAPAQVPVLGSLLAAGLTPALTSAPPLSVAPLSPPPSSVSPSAVPSSPSPWTPAPGEESRFIFSLKSTTTKYTFCFPTEEEKTSWAYEIDEVIQNITDQDRSRLFKTTYGEDIKFDSVVIDLEGKLDLQTSESPEQWKTRTIYLTATCLYWFLKGSANSQPIFDSSAKVNLIDLRNVAVHIVRVTQRPHVFQIATPGRIYFLAACDSPTMFEWIYKIRANIWKLVSQEDGAAARPSMPAGASAEEVLASLLKQYDNSICADCSSPNVNSASLNLGIFLCIQCAGIHRMLLCERSKVVSIRALTSVPMDLLKKLIEVGNQKANAEFEGKLTESVKKPQPRDSQCPVVLVSPTYCFCFAARRRCCGSSASTAASCHRARTSGARFLWQTRKGCTARLT